MNIPLSFIKRYIPVDDKDLICEGLVKLGIQVESVLKQGYDLRNVKIGRIVEKASHPKADKISVCKVDIKDDILQILTADPNVQVGDVVLVALKDCILPSGTKIDVRNIRGIDSYGMMLSTQELGWQNIKAHGTGVNKFNFDKKIASNIGKEINQVIQLSDWIIQIQPLANKVESWGIYHICKELSFVLNVEFQDFVYIQENIRLSENTEHFVQIDTPNCKYYKAILLKEIGIDYSPLEYQLLLNWMGTKPVNNVVDLTNFVMYDTSQPTHAFDKSKINGKIIVRQARSGEIIKALDGKDYELSQSDIVISDLSQNTLALAGIIGSREFSVSDQTNSIILEIANFSASNVRKTSKRLNLYTNSSRRFDKNIPTIYVNMASDRFISLLQEFKINCTIQSISTAGKIDLPKNISIDRKRISKFIGIDISKDELEKFAKMVSVESRWNNDEILGIQTYRSDINYWWDFAEEVCRFKGFNNIVKQALNSTDSATISYNSTKQKILKKIDLVKTKFVSNGYIEIIGYNLLNPKILSIFDQNYIQINNYMSIENSAYRSSIIPSIMNVVSRNYSAGYKDLKVFEIGKVYNSAENKEFYQLGFAVYSDTKSYNNQPHFFILQEIQRIKSIFNNDIYLRKIENIQYMDPAYEVIHSNKSIGLIGVLNYYLLEYFDYPPYTMVGKINIEEIEENETTFSELSYFSPIYKDISFYTDREIEYSYLIELLKNTLGEDLTLKKIYLIDLYQLDENKISYTFRLELKPKKEVTNQQLNSLFDSVFDELKNRGIYRRGMDL
ncbi:MAG: phenylalanine--tRNA ligase subunit beta [bacterium]